MKYLPEAKHASKVIFHLYNRPCGNVNENKHYFSGKSHPYCLRTEVSVLPTELAIGCSKSNPGSVADAATFRKRLATHRLWNEIIGDETDDLKKFGEEILKLPKHWAILANKRYYGLELDHRAVIFRKHQSMSLCQVLS